MVDDDDCAGVFLARALVVVVGDCDGGVVLRMS